MQGGGGTTVDVLPALRHLPLGEGISDNKQLGAPHVRQATRRCEDSLDGPWRRVKGAGGGHVVS